MPQDGWAQARAAKRRKARADGTRKTNNSVGVRRAHYVPLTEDQISELRQQIPCLVCGETPTRQKSGSVRTKHKQDCSVPGRERFNPGAGNFGQQQS